MHPSTTLATARRVLIQLRHDPRSLAMLLLVPCFLLALLNWVFDDERMFNRIGPSLLGVFPFLIMFLITSVTTLRERSSGTLERLLSMPTAKFDILGGYALAFGAVAAVQAALATGTALLLGLDAAGSVWLLGLLAVGNAVLGTALGLFVSAFADTEFQAVQFMPVVILPQFLLCGLLTPRENMNSVLEAVSNVLPMSYAVDGLLQVSTHASPTADYWRDLGVILGAVALALALGAATLRRRTR